MHHPLRALLAYLCCHGDEKEKFLDRPRAMAVSLSGVLYMLELRYHLNLFFRRLAADILHEEAQRVEDEVLRQEHLRSRHVSLDTLPCGLTAFF